MIKQITVAECDICGYTEKARPETFRSCKTARCWTKRPGVCADCPFDHDGKCYITGEDLYWNDGDNDDSSNIGNDCPLKPMPEPLRA